MNRTPTLLATTLILAFSVVACGGETASRSEVGAPEAKAMTERMLTGLNSADYATFSSDFGPVLLSALPEENFAELHERISQTSGKWLSVEDVTPYPEPLYTTFDLQTRFEKENVHVRIWFPESDRRMQGVWVDSPNLLAAEPFDDAGH